MNTQHTPEPLYCKHGLNHHHCSTCRDNYLCLLKQQRDDLLQKLEAIEMCLQMAEDCASDDAGLPQGSSTRRHIKHGLDICAKARGRHE